MPFLHLSKVRIGVIGSVSTAAFGLEFRAVQMGWDGGLAVLRLGHSAPGLSGLASAARPGPG